MSARSAKARESWTIDTPWREPVLLRFQRDGLVLCKRGPAPCERGDCLFQLATDLPGS